MNESVQSLKLALLGLGKISESHLEALSRPDLKRRFEIVGAHGVSRAPPLSPASKWN